MSSANPAGSITNSDLKLAGTIAQHDVLMHHVDCRERTIHTLTDNTPALALPKRGLYYYHWCAGVPTAPASHPSAPLPLPAAPGAPEGQLQWDGRRLFPAVASLRPSPTHPFSSALSPERSLATMPLEARHVFCTDLRASQEAARAGTTSIYSDRRDKSWDLWARFCLSLSQDPTLRDIPDPVHLLQVFATRVRDGRLAPSGRPVGHGTVSSALRNVGQTMAYMGAPDPRLDSHGSIDIRLHHQLRHYRKADPPPRRVQPIPLLIIKHLVQMVQEDPIATESRKAIRDLVILAFYFLMRPGEYCTSSGEDSSHPFHTDELELWRGASRFDLANATDHELQTATFCMLIFSDQKNSNRGEKVGHATSGDNIFCPVRALARRLIHLRRNQAPPHTAIHCYHEQFRGRQL